MIIVSGPKMLGKKANVTKRRSEEAGPRLNGGPFSNVESVFAVSGVAVVFRGRLFARWQERQ